jgi:hypothetical protein
MKEVYLNRFSDEIKKWYSKKTIPKLLICDVTKPQIGPTFVNSAPQMFKDKKKYSTFTQKSRDGVKRMLAFMKEVWCDNNDAQTKYILKWFASLLKGKKNQSIMYVKSIEGVGKSTFTDFFIEYVLGSDLHAKGDKECLCSANNMDLMGKPFVIFEELPVMNKNEWNVCDGKLKDMHWEIIYRKIIGIYRNFDGKLLHSYFTTVSEVFLELLAPLRPFQMCFWS